MKMNETSDDYDFTPTFGSGSHLKSLFDNSLDSLDNSSLTYTAPKQPKLGPTVDIPKDEPAKVETSVVCARVVQVWKLLEGKYIAYGKHGLAVIGSSTQNSFELILYKEKRDVIMRVKITANLEVTLKKNDFASFYDSANEFWLIKFNNHSDGTAITQSLKKCGGKVVSKVDNLSVGQKSEDSKLKENMKNEREITPSENTAKADILSRIAKMGQSILPNKNPDAETEPDGFLEIEISPPLRGSTPSQLSISPSSSPTPAVRGRTHSQLSIAPSSSANPGNLIQNPGPLQTVPNAIFMAQSVAYDPLNIYIAENRANSSEVRMNLSQITEKLNSIMKVMDTGRNTSDSDSEVLRSKVKVLELRNENLLKEISALQEKNVKLKNEAKHQEEVSLQLEKHKLELHLIEEREAARISELEHEVRVYQNKTEESSQMIEKQKNQIDELQAQIISHQEDAKWKSEIPKLQDTISSLKRQIAEFEEHSQPDGATKPSQDEIKEKNAKFISMIKNEMNGMFADIMSNLNESHENNTEISSTIAQNIKSTTRKIIQTSQQIYEIQ